MLRRENYGIFVQPSHETSGAAQEQISSDFYRKMMHEFAKLLEEQKKQILKELNNSKLNK